MKTLLSLSTVYIRKKNLNHLDFIGQSFSFFKITNLKQKQDQRLFYLTFKFWPRFWKEKKNPKNNKYL